MISFVLQSYNLNEQSRIVIAYKKCHCKHKGRKNIQYNHCSFLCHSMGLGKALSSFHSSVIPSYLLYSNFYDGLSHFWDPFCIHFFFLCGAQGKLIPMITSLHQDAVSSWRWLSPWPKGCTSSASVHNKQICNREGILLAQLEQCMLASTESVTKTQKNC